MKGADVHIDHVRGPHRAVVTVIEFGDFECPYCGQAEPVARELLMDTDLRFVWRHLPLTDVHPAAQLAAEAATRRSELVDSADTDRVIAAFPVFQIRFPNRWIIVDAGFDRATWSQFYGDTPVTYWPERWDVIQQAFRNADAIVLTHEHWDHAAGVERGTRLSEYASRTYVTPAQLSALRDPPAPLYVKLAGDSIPPYHRFDYDSLYALAPGVVLIKAPGHSPGSQWVYLQLASGAEALLVGDLVWNMAGLELGHQRPPSASASMKEDRAAVQQQLDLVRAIMRRGDVTIIPSHDDALLTSLTRSGVLRSGFDLSRR